MRVPVRLSRPTLSVLGSAVALASSVGCRPAPARRAPPSPLLDALGLAPPVLSDPRCRRERVHWRWSWHGMLTALTGRAGITCWLHERAGTAADGTAKRNVARVSLDPDGVVYNASRSAYGLRAAEAAAAADSVLARGWRLPACGRWRAPRRGTRTAGRCRSAGGRRPRTRRWCRCCTRNRRQRRDTRGRSRSAAADCRAAWQTSLRP